MQCLATVALVSDTHGVVDPDVFAKGLQGGAHLFLHAGDVGHHGGEQPVLDALNSSGEEVVAVRGNNDDTPGSAALPGHAVVEVAGWRVLVTHIVGVPPKVTPKAAALIAREQPDIVVSGHSHKFSCVRHSDGRWYLNPGAVGRSSVRTMALLRLPEKGAEAQPEVERVGLRAPRGGGGGGKGSGDKKRQPSASA